MRSWIGKLALLALSFSLTQPAAAGSLNDIFDFPHVKYSPAEFGGIVGEGKNGKYLGDMGDLRVTLTYLPDPEGGHPNGRHLRIFGVIPEIGITEPPCEELECFPSPIWIGIMIQHEPDEFPGPPGPGFLRFTYFVDEAHPALSHIDGTWDVRLPIQGVRSLQQDVRLLQQDVRLLQQVPAPAAGLLLGIGALMMLAIRARR